MTEPDITIIELPRLAGNAPDSALKAAIRRQMVVNVEGSLAPATRHTLELIARLQRDTIDILIDINGVAYRSSQAVRDVVDPLIQRAGVDADHTSWASRKNGQWQLFIIERISDNHIATRWIDVPHGDTAT